MGETSNGMTMGYVNLFYLSPKYRGYGLGRKIYDYTLGLLAQSGYKGATFRYVPGNTQAEEFYIKNGWYKSGAVDSN